MRDWKRNRVVKNAGWLVFGKLAQMVINLAVGLLTARYLGPSNYGVISYAAAYTGFFASFCTLGINSVIVKELLDHQDEQGEILGTTLLMQTVSSLLSAVAIMCIVYVADRGDPVVMTVVFLSGLGLIFQVFGVFHFWFQSRLQSKVSAMVSLIAYIITAVYKIILLVQGKTVVWFAFATALDHICVAVMLYYAYRRFGGDRLRISGKCAGSLLRKSCHFILPGLMVAVYAQTDKIMLKQMIDAAENGYYATAVSLCNTWCFVLSAIIDSLYPEIAKAHKTDTALYIRRNKQLYAIVFYIAAGVSVLISLLAEPIVLVMYGQDYLPTVGPLRIMTWYTAFSYLGVARNAWIVCENRQKYLVWVYLASAISNVLLNLLLIPAYGARGAAFASLAAQVITTMVAPCFISGLRENSKMMIQAILLRGLRP